MDSTRLGLRLRNLRQNVGLTEQAAAFQLQIPVELLTRFEDGMAELYLDEATRLAALYGTTTESLSRLADADLPLSVRAQEVEKRNCDPVSTTLTQFLDEKAADIAEVTARKSDGAHSESIQVRLGTREARSRMRQIAMVSSIAVLSVLMFTAGAVWQWDGRRSDRLPMTVAIEAVRHQADQDPRAATAALAHVNQAGHSALSSVSEHAMRDDELGVSARVFLLRIFFQLSDTLQKGEKMQASRVRDSFASLRERVLQKLSQ